MTNGRETVYGIYRGRGFAEAASLLGEEFAGRLVADGWAPYRCFEHPTLQTCLAHLLRRCHEMLETATRGAVRFPRQVEAHLQHALLLRDRRDAGEIGERGLRVAKGRLQAALGRRIRGRFTNPDNGRLARHLLRYEKALFVFLDHPDMEATNWPAEHAIRPAVVNRKSASGNRSPRGAEYLPGTPRCLDCDIPLESPPERDTQERTAPGVLTERRRGSRMSRDS